MGNWLALGLVIAAVAVLFFKHDATTIAGLDPSEFASMAALLAILIFLSGSLLGGYRGRLARAIRDGITWALFGFLLVGAYTYKDHLIPVVQRIVGEVVPGTPVAMEVGEDKQQTIRIRKQIDGQFVAQTRVNGVMVNMIVDTGASAVVLTPEDASEMGFDLASLKYTVPVQTANGRSFAAQVRLSDISIGPIHVGRVDALIAKPGTLHQSLLGMSFLSRLRSYEFSGDFLTLRS